MCPGYLAIGFFLGYLFRIYLVWRMNNSANQLLTLWMWECKLQGWMLDNRVIEELLQATEKELNYGK